MRVLVVNTGSSSVQLQLVETANAQATADDAEVRFSAKIEDLKREARLVTGGEQRKAAASSHADGARELMKAAGLEPGSIDAVAHRIVHGGRVYTGPVRIDENVLRAISELEILAPLHNRVAREAILAMRELVPRAPHVAVFDTSFHAGIPLAAKTYAIDPLLAEKHGIRRYGFHGTAYRYMVGRHARLAGMRVEDTRVVAVHLGGGCSVAAIEGGRSVETSMGMTPLEGLVMGTRAGDIDPGVLEVLARGEDLTAAEVVDLLNTGAGLRALSGTTEDTRDLVRTMGEDPRAKLALQVFCHRIVKYVGGYLAVLGGADAVLLGGVINENTPWVRTTVCRKLSWCGLTLDDEANADTIDREGRISSAASRMHAWVIRAREDLQLAFETARLLQPDA